MIHKLTYAVNSKDDNILRQFVDRLALTGIQTEQLKLSEKYTYFESVWNDDYIPKVYSNKGNAGAKPKRIKYNGNSVTCGLVYLMKNEKGLSDAEIGLLLDVSESTISRRRKKHMESGCFYEGSTAIF